MTAYRSSMPLVYALMVAVFGHGCSGCNGDVVARLSEVEADVKRDFAKEVGVWQAAAPGERFHVGDGVRTGAASKAMLHLTPEGQLEVQSETAVRFTDRAPGRDAAGVQLETGEIVVDSAHVTLDVLTPYGIARLGEGSRVRLRAEGTAQRLEVLVGRVRIDPASDGEGAPIELTAGRGVVLEVGKLAIDPATPPQDEPQVPPHEVPEAVELAAAQPMGTLEALDAKALGLDESAPTQAKFTMVAGETVTIHDPRPPTRVRLTFQGCDEAGLLEVTGGPKPRRVAGSGSAIVQLGPGRHRYRLRCLEQGTPGRETRASGAIHVVRDAALRRLPARPQQVTVDADGMKYTVRYANLLPQITVRWPKAPEANRYTLRVVKEGGATLEEQVSSASHNFAAGKFGEGSYRFQYQAQDGRRSPEGRLRIEFDNAASTAWVSAPADGFPIDGGKIRVAGAVLARSDVSVEGRRVATDAEGRFSTEVAAPREEDAIAIRVSHPATGVHYYLRHAARASERE